MLHSVLLSIRHSASPWWLPHTVKMTCTGYCSCRASLILVSSNCRHLKTLLECSYNHPLTFTRVNRSSTLFTTFTRAIPLFIAAYPTFVILDIPYIVVSH